MHSSINDQMPADGVNVEADTAISSQTQSKPQPTIAILRLPDVFELANHLRLLDAIVILKHTIYDQGEEKGMEGVQAWEQFCQAASEKFLEWSENVDVSMETIPTPQLDILMVWQSFMLNTSAYAQFEKQDLRGRMAGKGIDWQDLKFKLDSVLDEIADLALSWKDSEMTPPPKLQDSSINTDFDMVAAVQRQLKFAEKMYGAQWRNKTTVNGFLEAAIHRYKEFFTLIAENPGVGMHTHQLSPKRYASYSRHMTNGRFVVHDDNLDETSLEQSALTTEKLYFEKYGVPYKPWKRRGKAGGDANAPEHPSTCSGGRCTSTGCSSGGCNSGCGSSCAGQICRNHCREACGYNNVCGACDTKE
ncbi:hypothetical protein diail_12109 [Diaporthe ilicicola]|nr:hypothetical protein diail_12109 [Diaporthe ilicicola]